MKTLWCKSTIALVLLLFYQNQTYTISVEESVENKALFKKIYYKTRQYGKYAFGGGLVAVFGPSVATGAAVAKIGKVVVDSVYSDRVTIQNRLHKVDALLADFMATTFAGASMLTGVAVFVYVLTIGVFKASLKGAAGGVAIRAVMDASGFPDINSVYDVAEKQITTLLTEEQAETSMRKPEL